MRVFGAIAMMTQDIVLQQEKYLYTVEQLALTEKDLNIRRDFFHIFCSG
jgi:hypothetical protein